MVTPQGKEECITVTILMAGSLGEKARKERQKPAFFKKMSPLISILSNKSPPAGKILPEEVDPSLVGNNMLTAHLIIHPPYNGKFTAALQLKDILGQGRKDLVVKVYGTWLEILFAESLRPLKHVEKPEIAKESTTKQKIYDSLQKIILPHPKKWKRKMQTLLVPRNLKVETQTIGD